MQRRFTIGRDGRCDVPIADDSVSRIHAEIWLAEDGSLFLSDRGSSNGTTILRAGQSFPLKQDVVLPADHVRFGGVTLPISELIAAIETKNPGALTPKSARFEDRPPAAAAPFAPPPPPPFAGPPPVAPRAGPPPIPGPPAVPGPPPIPGGGGRALAGPPPIQGGLLVRCECGAIKTTGQPCPGCHR